MSHSNHIKYFYHLYSYFIYSHTENIKSRMIKCHRHFKLLVCLDFVFEYSCIQKKRFAGFKCILLNFAFFSSSLVFVGYFDAETRLTLSKWACNQGTAVLLFSSFSSLRSRLSPPMPTRWDKPRGICCLWWVSDREGMEREDILWCTEWKGKAQVSRPRFCLSDPFL